MLTNPGYNLFKFQISKETFNRELRIQSVALIIPEFAVFAGISKKCDYT